MKAHLISLLSPFEAEQHFLFIVFMCLGAVALKAKGREILASKLFLYIWYIAIGASGLLIAAYLVMLMAYLRFPNYLDHVEPTVASVAWLGMHGHVLYPNWVSDDIYGLVYGPILYLLHGLFLLLHPTITTSKVLGVVSLVLAFYLFFVVTKEKPAGNFSSLLLLASLAMLFVPLGPYVYWTRPEPFLILISALALLVATRLRPMAAGTIIGVLAGLATGFKLHGFVYVAPMAIMTLARANSLHDRVVLASTGFACAIITALLPFCLKESSLVGYWEYLKIAAHHPSPPGAFSANVLFALVLFMPSVVVWVWRRPTLNRTELWLLIGTGLSIAFIVLIGSISGPYHLIPFAPVCLYAAIIIADAPASKPASRQIFAFIFLLLLFAYSPAGYVLNKRLASHYRNSQTEHEKITELKTYLERYPDAQIGISDDAHYFDTYYRIFSVFQGHPLRVDFVAWEDLAYVGVDENNVVRFIKTCEVPTWILPLGAPFTKLSWYTKQPILSDEFRRIFFMNYQLVHTGQAYQVWQCRSSSERSDETKSTDIATDWPSSISQ